MKKYADVEVRKELVVLYHILKRKGILTDEDLDDMNKGISRF